MRRPTTSTTTYLAALFALAAMLSLAVADPSDTTAPAPAGTTARVVPDLSGSWTGTWEDTVYFVQGDLEMTVTASGADWSAVGTIDLTNIGMPGVGVMTGTAVGTLSGNTLTFTFDAVDVGAGSGSLTDGAGQGSGSVTAPLSFGAFTFTGSVTSSSITGAFDFTSPTGGAGEVAMTRAVSATPTSWSALKSSWR